MTAGSSAESSAITGQLDSRTICSISSSACCEERPSPTSATSGRSRAVTAPTAVTSTSPDRLSFFHGFELAEELRRDERTRAIPFIFSSGDTTAGNEARAPRLGAIAYPAKPLNPAVLAALVTGALSRA